MAMLMKVGYVLLFVYRFQPRVYMFDKLHTLKVFLYAVLLFGEYHQASYDRLHNSENSEGYRNSIRMS